MNQPMGGFIPGVSPFAPATQPVYQAPSPGDYTVRPAEADIWYAWTENGHPYEWLSKAEYERRMVEAEAKHDR